MWSCSVLQKDRHKDKHKDKKKKKKKDGDTNGDAHGKSFSLLLSFCYTGMPNVPCNLPEFTHLYRGASVDLECRLDPTCTNICRVRQTCLRHRNSVNPLGCKIT